jgi:hypothetical protein
MIRNSLTLLIAVMALALVVAGCSQAPSIPHPSEGLEPVDCLACHELGLKGATILPQSHFNEDGTVRRENCTCHRPAELEEQTSWDQSSQPWGTGGVLGMLAVAVVLPASGLAVAMVGQRRESGR